MAGKQPVGIAALALCAVLQAGCGREQPPAEARKIDPHLQLQLDMEKGTMDLSRVLIIRLTLAGKRLEVTSLTPTVVAEAQVAGQPAKTLFKVNDQKDLFLLFSRDAQKNASVTTTMAIDKLGPGTKFSFPVVQPDGSLKKEEFTVERVLRPLNQ